MQPLPSHHLALSYLPVDVIGIKLARQALDTCMQCSVHTKT
jgi:hypothetical protein